MNSELKEALEKFLAERRESDGGYAKPTEEDMRLFNYIITLLIQAKFGPDPDGDRPIHAKLYDMGKGRIPYFIQVPHVANDFAGAFHASVHNLGIASDEMNKLYDLIEVYVNDANPYELLAKVVIRDS